MLFSHKIMVFSGWLVKILTAGDWTAYWLFGFSIVFIQPICEADFRFWMAAIAEASNLSHWDFMEIRLEVELVWEFVKDILKKLKDMLFLSDSRGLIGLSSWCEVPDFRMVLNLWHGWRRENDHRWRCFQQCFKYFWRQEFCGKVLGAKCQGRIWKKWVD